MKNARKLRRGETDYRRLATYWKLPEGEEIAFWIYEGILLDRNDRGGWLWVAEMTGRGLMRLPRCFAPRKDR